MKPSFALNLSHDGISLFHRSSAGWFSAGFVSLEEDDFAGAMAHLRQTALGLSARGITSKLVIPDSQILYLMIEAPGPDAARRRSQIAAALEGRTPYAVNDLVFDWSGTGHSVQVAVVARETLIEAEDFAEQYNFGPVSFVAIPEPGDFAGEPFFGLTSTAAQHLPEGSRLDRDQDPVRLIQTPRTPKVGIEAAEEAPEAATQAVAGPTQAATDVDTLPLPNSAPAFAATLADEAAITPDGRDAAKTTAATIDMDAARTDTMAGSEPPRAEFDAPDVHEAVGSTAALDASHVAPELPEVPETPVETPANPEPELPQPDLPQPEAPQPADPQPEAPQPEAPQPADPQPEGPEAHDPQSLRDALQPGDMHAPQDAGTAPEVPLTAAQMPPVAPPPLDPQDHVGAEHPERGLDAVLADESFAPEAIAALAEALQEDTLTTPAARFVSRRSPMTAAAVIPNGAPRLGGATLHDLPPPAPKTKALAAETPRPSVLTPELAVPAATEIDTAGAFPLAKGRGAKPDPAAPQGVRAKFRAAAKTIARVNTSTVRNVPAAGKPDADPAAEPAAKTVFGGPKMLPQRNKPRYFGLMLTAALLLFMGVVALWSSLLGTRSQPEVVAPLTLNEADPVVAPADGNPSPLENAPDLLSAETAVAAVSEAAPETAPETVPVPDAATEPEPAQTPTVASEAVAPQPEAPVPAVEEPAVEEMAKVNPQGSVWGAVDLQTQGRTPRRRAVAFLASRAADPASSGTARSRLRRRPRR